MEEDQESQTFAVIVGNREYFPDQLAEEGGEQIIEALEDLGVSVVTGLAEAGLKSVQTRKESKICAQSLKKHADIIEGVVITLPNFGDEKSIVETLRLSHLDVPVLVHAFPDEMEKMDRAHRRDSFCGKFSVCNNLHQYRIKFTNTQKHVEAPDSQEFKDDITFFKKVCRTVKRLKNARLGVIGVRPNAFQTVRYSEKILEKNGISVEVVSLMEIIHQAKAMRNAPHMKNILTQMEQWFYWDNVPKDAVTKTASLAAVLSAWVRENEIDALSFNCWPAIEKFYEIAPCAAMSLVSQWLIPAACETDAMGALSMFALQLAAQAPAALVDLNNNFGNTENKCVFFHCSAVAPHFFETPPLMGCHEMQGCYGALSGKIATGPVTLFRVSTDDITGRMRAYCAEGHITDDQIETFGTYGVVEIENLQSLLEYVADNGFEHHVAIVRTHVADVVEEAVAKYLNWEFHRHSHSKNE